jgi:hypothetical protein
MRLQTALCAVLAMLPSMSGAQTASTSMPIVWANDHARFVIESVGPDGKLTGTYQNGSTILCAGMVYPVTGWIDGNRISYTVLRKDPRGCGNLQTWTGFFSGAELVVQYLDVFSKGAENTIVNGSDSYRLQ